MREIITCEFCGEPVEIHRSIYIPTDYEGVCPKCGKRVVRRLYKCRVCKRYTLHRFYKTIQKSSKDKYGHVSLQPFHIYICEECGNKKSIFAGLRAPSERSMMPV